MKRNPFLIAKKLLSMLAPYQDAKMTAHQAPQETAPTMCM